MKGTGENINYLDVQGFKKHSGNHIIVLNFTLHTCIAGKKKKKKKEKTNEHWIFFAYVFLRKNPPKIRRGRLRGVPRDVAAVTVGAIVDTI